MKLTHMDDKGITHAAAATGITVLGVVTGLSYEVLLAGFAGGLVSLSFLSPVGIWQRIWTPITATLTAGYTAPVACSWGTRIIGEPNPLAMLVFSAFIIGVLTQALIPIAFRMAHRRADALQGPSQ